MAAVSATVSRMNFSIPFRDVNVVQLRYLEAILQQLFNPECNETHELAVAFAQGAKKDYSIKLPPLGKAEKHAVEVRVRETLARSLGRATPDSKEIIDFEERVDLLCCNAYPDISTRLTALFIKFFDLLKNPQSVTKTTCVIVYDSHRKKTEMKICDYLQNFMWGMCKIMKVVYSMTYELYSEEAFDGWKKVKEEFDSIYQELSEIIGLLRVKKEDPWLIEFQECLMLIKQVTEKPGILIPYLLAQNKNTNPSFKEFQEYCRLFIELSPIFNSSFDDHFKLIFKRIDEEESADEGIKNQIRSLVRQYRAIAEGDKFKKIIEKLGEIVKELSRSEECCETFMGYSHYCEQILRFHSARNALEDAMKERRASLHENSNEIERISPPGAFRSMYTQLRYYNTHYNYTVVLLLNLLRDGIIPLFDRFAEEREAQTIITSLCRDHIPKTALMSYLDQMQLALLKELPPEKHLALYTLFAKIRHFLNSREKMAKSTVLEEAFNELTELHPTIQGLKKVLVPYTSATFLLRGREIEHKRSRDIDHQQFNEVLPCFPQHFFREMEEKIAYLIQKCETKTPSKALTEFHQELSKWNKRFDALLEESDREKKLLLFFEGIEKIDLQLKKIDIDELPFEEARDSIESFSEQWCSIHSFFEGFRCFANELSLYVSQQKRVVPIKMEATAAGIVEATHPNLRALQIILMEEQDSKAVDNMRLYLPMLEELLNGPKDFLQDNALFLFSRLALLLEQSLNCVLEREGIDFKKDHDLEGLAELTKRALPPELREVLESLNGYNNSKAFYSEEMQEKAWSNGVQALHTLAERAFALSMLLLKRESCVGDLSPKSVMKGSFSLQEVVNLAPIMGRVKKINELCTQGKLAPAGIRTLFLRERQVSLSCVMLQNSISRISAFCERLHFSRATFSLWAILNDLGLIIEQTEKLLLARSPFEEGGIPILKTVSEGRPLRYCHNTETLFGAVRKAYGIKVNTDEMGTIRRFSHMIGYHGRYPSQFRGEHLADLQEKARTLREREDGTGMDAFLKSELPPLINSVCALANRLLSRLV